MRHAHLLASAAVAVALVYIGWGANLLTDITLVIGGLFAGHVLTELLNDPTE
jgi:hypothetical protein